MNLQTVIDLLESRGYTVLDQDGFYVALQEDERVTDELFTHGSSEEIVALVVENPTSYVKAGVLR